MIDPKKKAAKVLKRKRKVAMKKKIERQQIASGNIIMFGKGRNKIMMKKKPTDKNKVAKKVKPIPAYRVVILTARMDKMNAKIKSMATNDPKLKSLKERRDIIKNKLK